MNVEQGEAHTKHVERASTDDTNETSTSRESRVETDVQMQMVINSSLLQQTADKGH